jgi:hypothetical protein
VENPHKEIFAVPLKNVDVLELDAERQDNKDSISMKGEDSLTNDKTTEGISETENPISTADNNADRGKKITKITAATSSGDESSSAATDSERTEAQESSGGSISAEGSSSNMFLDPPIYQSSEYIGARGKLRQYI